MQSVKVEYTKLKCDLESKAFDVVFVSDSVSFDLRHKVPQVNSRLKAKNLHVQIKAQSWSPANEISARAYSQKYLKIQMIQNDTNDTNDTKTRNNQKRQNR